MPAGAGMTQTTRAREDAAMPEFLDLALVYDPAARRGDLALGADGDLVLDDTPATPMQVSLGSDRRARPDDPLPVPAGAIDAPSSFFVRRGWAGDALDAERRPIGSRLWLLERAKQSEIVRRLAEEWAREALAWAEAETGSAAEVAALWLRAGVLALTARVDGRAIAMSRRIAA